MQNWLQKWLNDDKKPLINEGLSKEITQLLNYLVNEIDDGVDKKSFQRRVNDFYKRKLEEQIENLPEIYLFFEQYLGEINKSSKHSHKSLHKYVIKNFTEVLKIESFKFIFEHDEDKQKILLAKQFLIGVIKRCQQVLGATEENLLSKLTQWLEGVPEQILYPIPLDLELKNPDNSDEIVDVFSSISVSLFTKITDRFSESFARKFYKETYSIIANKYKSLNTFSVVLELFPNAILDADQVNLLSKNQIQKVLMSKLELLETTLEQLTEKNEEFRQSQAQLIKSEAALSEQNRKMQDSIHYAKSIQKAMLVNQEKVLSHFKDAFILLEPRDVVSGDFYWFAKEDDKVFIAAVDCTGHGVPGSLMSMIANNLLNEIVYRRKYLNTSEILNQLQKGIVEALQQEETKNKDGLDIALCKIDTQLNILEYSGARRPLVYIQDGNLHEIKGNRQSIGGYDDLSLNKNFKSHQIDLEQNRSFYLFSDGYYDQFGYDDKSSFKSRKFLAKRFKKLLLENVSETMQKQKEILRNTFLNWKGDNQQIDDVLVIGFQPIIL